MPRQLFAAGKVIERCRNFKHSNYLFLNFYEMDRCKILLSKTISSELFYENIILHKITITLMTAVIFSLFTCLPER